MTDNTSVVIRVVSLIKQLARSCRLDNRSVSYVIKRFTCEGIAFLTKELPKLSKAVLHSIEVGYFDRTTLTSFTWKGTSLRFFRSWLNRLFDLSTGNLLADPDPSAIYQLRQFTEYFYKLALEFSGKDLREAAAAFMATEEELFRAELDMPFVERVRRTFETIFPEIANETIEGIFSEYRPRTTSGTFSRVDGDASYRGGSNPHLIKKRHSNVWGYPADCAAYKGVFKPYPGAKTLGQLNKQADFDLSHYQGGLREVADSSNVSEVLFVPKDSRGPRTIVREPLKRLSLQMAYFDFLTDKLQRSTNGNINFDDQVPFRNLAEDSSKTRENCTMDLREASDRVNSRVVGILFRNAPGLRWFTSRRSKQVFLKGVGKLPLRKLAGMGSGLTFPTMALLIFLVCYLALRDLGYTHKNAFKSVYVYGDDIIVPTHAYSACAKYLARIGFVVNDQKSFHRSHFRESCGGDYYAGIAVKPLRLRLSGGRPSYDRKSRSLKIDLSSVDEIISHAHLWITECADSAMAEFYYTAAEKALGSPLPGIVSPDAPILGRLDKEPEVQTTSNGSYRRKAYITSSPITLITPSACQDSNLSRALATRKGDVYDYSVYYSFDSLQTRINRDMGNMDYKQVPIPYRKRLKRVKLPCAVQVFNYQPYALT